jgi:predicted metal-dependent hydrolase
VTAVLDTLFRRDPQVRTQTVELNGQRVPVTVRRSVRARRMILRVEFDTGDVVVTIPRSAPFEHGLVMARSRADWILERLDRLPPHVAFRPEAIIPVLGEPHRIAHRSDTLRGVRRDQGTLLVGGPVDSVNDAVHRWLRAEARREVRWRSLDKAGRLGVPVSGIAVRDTRTRWGSCSASSALSFSWRLILAPEHVLDYVVAHEVAHLRVRGHGAEFWKTAERLTDTMQTSRTWLARHGHTLHRYG